MAAEPKKFIAKTATALPKPLIRRLRPEDAGAVAEIARESETAAAWSLQSIEETIAGVGVLALASEGAGKLTGFLFARQTADDAELLNIAVRKNWQRNGRGTALLSIATDELCSNGVRRIFLEVRESNRAAISFYTKHGFVEAGRRKGYYRDPVEDALCMEKKFTT